ncbi:MAG: methyltransferase domain-containing protein [Defluviitaleaceae bacterium]|nr:methyltransferase domain-containing protein [Defluviitaleaceae bacterium]
MHNTIKERFDERSDIYFSNIQVGLDILNEKVENAFPAVVWDMIHQDIPDLRGKRVLVPSSGDSIMMFAFHLMGAKVTSCDISDSQLNNAKKIADKYGWDIEFIQQDSMLLDKIPNETYDLLYTSNGVHVWIHDLLGMYNNFYRVLKPGGRYIMCEIHPFLRPFDMKNDDNIVVKKPYSETGPYPNEGVFTYTWRLQDFINNISSAGFRITRMEEFTPGTECWDIGFYNSAEEAKADNHRKYDWKLNPWAALPQWFGLSAIKVTKSIIPNS